MLKASIVKAPFLIDFEKSPQFSLILFENVRKISSILLNFFLNCPWILQNFSLNLLDFEFQNAVGTLQIMGINTQRVIQSVKFHISHQMKPYSNVKVIWGSGYTCFSIFWEL